MEVAASSSLMSQLALRQMQQEADRAEVTARSLRAKAQAAERDANQAQENARSLRVQSGQADQRAGSARQGVYSLQSGQRLESSLNALREQIAGLVESPADASVSQPAVNAEGQTTGTMVNTTA